MNIDTYITIGSNEIYVGLTPFEFSYDKSWGMTFNILKWSLHLKEAQMVDDSYALFSYTNTHALRQLEVLGVKLITKFK